MELEDSRMDARVLPRITQCVGTWSVRAQVARSWKSVSSALPHTAVGSSSTHPSSAWPRTTYAELTPCSKIIKVY